MQVAAATMRESLATNAAILPIVPPTNPLNRTECWLKVSLKMPTGL